MRVVWLLIPINDLQGNQDTNYNGNKLINGIFELFAHFVFLHEILTYFLKKYYDLDVPFIIKDRVSVHQTYLSSAAVIIYFVSPQQLF